MVRREVEALVGGDFDGEVDVGVVFVGLACFGVVTAHGQCVVVAHEGLDASLVDDGLRADGVGIDWGVGQRWHRCARIGRCGLPALAVLLEQPADLRLGDADAVGYLADGVELGLVVEHCLQNLFAGVVAEVAQELSLVAALGEVAHGE